MTLGFYLRHLVRDSRGARGRLAFFAVCLAIGVAAVVAVAALAEGLDEAVRREAKQLLGGDLEAKSRRPLPESVHEHAAARAGSQRVTIRELATMAAVPERSGQPSSQLVELKVVSGPYPLYGELATEPAGPIALGDDTVIVAPELAARLGLAVGDSIAIGRARFRVGAVLRGEPDRVVSPFALGPRVLMPASGFERTALETFGSRIEYRLLWRLPGNPDRATVEAEATALREALEGTSSRVRVRTYLEAQASLRDGLERLESFLGLLALLSLLLGGVGVAQSVRAFLASRLNAVAVSKCLGLRPREALALYVGQCLVLGGIGSLAGGALGLVLQAQLPLLLGDLIPEAAVQLWRPRALGRGLGLGLATSALFSLGPLAAVLRVPPILALRRNAEPLPTPRGLRLALASTLVAGTALLATWQAGSIVRGLGFTLALAATVVVLGLSAVALRRATRWLRRSRLPLTLRQGAALAAHPGSDSLGAITALGLGVLVVLSTVLVQRQLTDSLEAELPAAAPDTFLIDIQPDQWPGVREILDRHGAENVDSVPVVMGRFAAIDGTPVAEMLADAEGNRRWALTREQRLTYLDELPPDNRLVAGDWWQPGVAGQVSLEEEYARELGVGVGSRLAFDVQGVPVELEVSSLRAVDWRTFRINFFLVVSPGTLEEAPQNRLAAASLPTERQQSAQDEVVAAYPNVTLVDVRGLLAEIARLLRRLALGIRWLGGFTAIAGLTILVGAVAATTLRRARTLALLKTLGFTRLGVGAVLAWEFLFTGLAAAGVGTLAAVGLSWAVVTRVMELEAGWFPGTYGLAVVFTLVLTVSAGLLASARALRVAPMEVWRGERE